MAASFNIELSPRPNREGLHTIYLRITAQRRHKRIKTSILIDKKYYNPDAEYGRWVRKTHPRHRQINDSLISVLEEARLQNDTMNSTASAETIASRLINTNALRLSDYFDSCITDTFSTNTYNYAIHSKSILNQFVRFLPKDILVSEVTPYHIIQYKIHLLKKSHVNTVRVYLKKISKQFKKACSEEILPTNPCDKVDWPKAERSNRIKLSESQIETLKSVKPERGRMNNWDELAIELYLFSYLHGGIRLGDLIQLRVKNFENGRLTYEMNKTGLVKSVKVRPEALPILEKYSRSAGDPDDYFFPLMDSKASYAKYITKVEKSKMPLEVKRIHYYDVCRVKRGINAWLKKKAELGEIEGVTFHTARHSFADKARRMMKEKKNITIDGIRLMLGHSSLATTQRYLNNFDLEGQDEAHDAIFGD